MNRVNITKTYVLYRNERLGLQQLNIEDLKRNKLLNAVADKRLLQYLKDYLISSFDRYINAKSLLLGEVDDYKSDWHYGYYAKHQKKLFFHPMANLVMNTAYQIKLDKLIKQELTRLKNVKRLKNPKHILKRLGENVFYNNLLIERMIEVNAKETADCFLSNKVISHFLNNTTTRNPLPNSDYLMLNVDEKFRCHRYLQPYRGKTVVVKLDNDWCNMGNSRHEHWYRTIHISCF